MQLCNLYLAAVIMMMIMMIL